MANRKKFEPNAEEIAATNPKVDYSVVREARELIAKRRAQGFERRGYDLASPHERYPRRDPS